MFSPWPYVCALGALLFAAPAAIARDDGDASAHHPSRLIVKYRGSAPCHGCGGQRRAESSDPGSDALALLDRRFRVKRGRPVFGVAANDRLARARARFEGRAARAPHDLTAPDLDRVHVLELSPGVDVLAAAEAYAKEAGVEYAHPDYVVRVGLVPNDTYFGDLYGLQITETPAAWDTATGAGAVVAIVDTGIDEAHPDLAANMWVNPGEVANNGLDDDDNGYVDDVHGWDFVEDDADPFDDHGHGTHVAGTVAAVGQNARGVIGMAFGARVMSVKGLSGAGSGYTSDLAAGLVYAAENGADVLNNSWGGFGISTVLVDAVVAARALGAVVVAAAGNEASFADRRQLAGIPGVITVGATDSSDAIASFSNFGAVLSVAAPGVSVLSLRGSDADGLGNNGIVGTQYQRLSGTSMATPHAAGLAAVLLSAMPGLTDDEVRWHLELNADQPGIPGYEGAPWNPSFGWGRINARRVFDAPPVTTRVTGQPHVMHGIEGAVLPNASFLNLGFTTHDPVPWTITSPSWLVPSVTSGSAPARIDLALDTTATPPGPLAGSALVDAPSTVDGGGSLGFSAFVHRDERVGPMIGLDDDLVIESGPAVASDGVGTIVGRVELGVGPVLIARRVLVTQIDSAGNPTSTFEAVDTPYSKGGLVAAFDGRQYLVVWIESYHNDESVRALRFAADGRPIDTQPIIVEALRLSDDEGLATVDVAFDGAGFTVLWQVVNSATDISKLYVRRVGVDGNLRGRKRVQLYPDRGDRLVQAVTPRMACVPGSCLVAWCEADGTTDPTGRYVRSMWGLRLVGDQPQALVAHRLMTDAHRVYAATSDGHDFAILALRTERCPDGGIGEGVVLTRVAADGSPIDPTGIRVDRQPPNVCMGEAEPVDVAFDGAQYQTLFRVPGPPTADGDNGTYLFNVGVAIDGSITETEPLGVLLHEGPLALTRARVTASYQGSLVAWLTRRRIFEPSFTVRDDLVARRVLPRPTSPGHPEATIGAIGSRSVAERATLVFTVRAPAGMNPATTTLTAVNVPAGAIFDGPTGTFRWQPRGTDAGLVVNTTFEARDGATTASETVAFSATEATLSISGRVRRGNGTIVDDVDVQIVGVPGEKRVAFTDGTGWFSAEGLAPRPYRLKLGPVSKKRYRLVSGTALVALGGADRAVPDLIVEPK